MEAISAALKLTDVKKSGLREAFDDLQFRFSSLSNFDLTWSDLDCYFTSIQTLLEQQFKKLEKYAPQCESQPSAVAALSSSPDPAAVATPMAPPVSPRPQLKAYCVAMDGVGLRNYLNEHPKERMAIRKEIPAALLCAPNPAAMILDAMEGFFRNNPKGHSDPALIRLRKNCVLLLEELLDLKIDIDHGVKERAKRLAMEWKSKVITGGEASLNALVFLHLLAAYGLRSEFEQEYVVDLFVDISKCRQAFKLCRMLLTSDKIPDLTKKLIDGGNKLLAVKFIFEFKLTNEFQPVPLMKAAVVDTKNIAKNVRKDGNNSLQSLNEATVKEIGALKQLIKVIEDNNLDSEYPKQNLVKRIEELEKKMAGRKRPTGVAALKKQPHAKTQQQNGSKRQRLTVSKSNSTVSSFQQHHLQSSGLLPNHAGPYLTASPGPYGAADPYPGSLSRLYNAPGASMDFPGHPNPQFPSGSHIHPAEYGGYGLLPHYQPPYYP